MSKHFCFCIPVRVAVFFLSLLTTLAAGASAALGWIILYDLDNNKLGNLEKNMTDEQKQDFEAFVHKYRVGFIIVSAVFTVIAIMSLFGFIGSIIRNRRMVKAYSYMTFFIFFAGSACAGFILYLVWSNKCQTIDNEQICFGTSFSKSQKIWFTVYTVIEWLFQLYIVIVIRRYYEQLEEEREYRHDFRLTPTAGGTYEAKEGLLTQGHYPYTDNNHAFGSRA